VKKVITFGEILMRLSPPEHLRFDQTTSFNVLYGGAEFNVATSLSKFEVNTEFVTVIPDNDIGNCALDTVKKYGVGSQHIKKQGERLGIYFLENGSGNRNSKVVYDRSNSAISGIKTGVFDWESIFKDVDWFHWSGITPALSMSAAEVCLEAIEAASKMGITISTDLNYRSKLWQYGKEPHEIMPNLLKYSNVILGDIDTMLFMLGEQTVAPDYANESHIKHHFNDIIEQLPNVEVMAMTFRNIIHATHQKIGGLLFKDGELYKAPVRDVTNIIDRVGTGDAFMGALIYGLLTFSSDLQKVVSFAAAACVLKHTIFGDANRVTVEEINRAMAQKGTIKVDR